MIQIHTTLRSDYSGSELVGVWQDPSRIVSDRVPIVLCHGATGSALDWYDPEPPAGGRFQAAGVTRRDMVAFGADLGGTLTWGNDASIDAIDDLLLFGADADNYATRTNKVALIGHSMGAAVALNWAWRNISKVAGVGLVLPAIDLEGIHTRDPAGLASTLESAYGGETEFFDALDEHDPIRNTDLISQFADLVRIWYSTDDTIIVPDEVLAFAEASGVEAISVGAAGHTLNWNEQQVLDWFVPTVRSAAR